MITPRPPIEDGRPGRFRPTHCTRPDCSAHTLSEGFRWRKRGSYRTKSLPNRRTPVIECLHCGKRMSRSAYSCTYYMKKPELLPDVARGLVACGAHRQIARTLKCAPSTVTRIAARLGRHALLYQARAIAMIGAPDEPIAFDHLVTFTHSQIDRLGIATPIGARSWFDYGCEAATYRGSSRRAARKARVRSPQPDHEPDAVKRSLEAALNRLISPGNPLELISDDHPAYPRAIRAARHGALVSHRVYPNPPRATPQQRLEARARDHAMFPVDMVHQFTRHSLSHHARETIAFARRANASIERAMIFGVWRNFIKRRSERKPDHRSPAMLVGLATRRFRWREVLSRRLFPGRIELSPSWTAIYRRELTTPAVGRNLRHDLVHAY